MKDVKVPEANRLQCCVILMRGEAELLSHDSFHDKIHSSHWNINNLGYLSMDQKFRDPRL